MIDPAATADPAGPVPQPPRLLDLLRQVALAHFSRPEPAQRFADWTRRFILFHDKLPPRQPFARRCLAEQMACRRSIVWFSFRVAPRGHRESVSGAASPLTADG
jgi:hypothetical protein